MPDSVEQLELLARGLLEGATELQLVVETLRASKALDDAYIKSDVLKRQAKEAVDALANYKKEQAANG